MDEKFDIPDNTTESTIWIDEKFNIPDNTTKSVWAWKTIFLCVFILIGYGFLLVTILSYNKSDSVKDWSSHWYISSYKTLGKIINFYIPIALIGLYQMITARKFNEKLMFLIGFIICNLYLLITEYPFVKEKFEFELFSYYGLELVISDIIVVGVISYHTWCKESTNLTTGDKISPV